MVRAQFFTHWRRLLTTLRDPCGERIWCVSIVATVAILLLYAIEGRVGFSLWDEGFLWYGARQVLHGEVPIRDYMAYDVGRYYLSAGVMAAVGDNGIIALRWTLYAVQWFGLGVALLLLSRGKHRCDLWYLLIAAIVIVLWMYPRHKLFDISLSILLIASVSFVVKVPNHRRFFWLGVAVGVAAIFGRNHGLYGVVGSAMAFVYLQRGADMLTIMARAGRWCGGLLIGYLPMVVGLAVVPGFLPAFVDSIIFILERGSTNVAVPVPWPWLMQLQEFDARAFLIGIFFILLVAGPVLLWLLILRRQHLEGRPVLVACAVMSVPYAHYAFSRADMAHLAQGIFPVLIGVLYAMRAVETRWIQQVAGMGVVAGISLYITAPVHPAWMSWQDGLRPAVVGKDHLLIDLGTAQHLDLLSRATNCYAPDTRPFLAVPYWPGAYPAFEKTAPVWAIYPLWPRSDEFQRREINRIEQNAPGYVIITDWALDGREENRFRRTNSLIYEYIREYFVNIKDGADDGVEIYINSKYYKYSDSACLDVR